MTQIKNDEENVLKPYHEWCEWCGGVGMVRSHIGDCDVADCPECMGEGQVLMSREDAGFTP